MVWPPCVNCPVILLPSAESVPLKAGEPGTPAISNETWSACTLTFARGRSLAFCCGIEMSPAHEPSSFLVKSMSTERRDPGTSIPPSQCPAMEGVCAATVCAAATITHRRRASDRDECLMVVSFGELWDGL